MTCKACGEDIPSSESICPRCGVPLGDEKIVYAFLVLVAFLCMLMVGSLTHDFLKSVIFGIVMGLIGFVSLYAVYRFDHWLGDEAQAERKACMEHKKREAEQQSEAVRKAKLDQKEREAEERRKAAEAIPQSQPQVVSPGRQTNAAEKPSQIDQGISSTVGCGLCLFSLLLPVVGVIIAAIFLSRGTEDARRVGENCLGWAFLGFVVDFFLWMSYIHSVHRLLQLVG